MKILHILNDAPDDVTKHIIDMMDKDNESIIVDLNDKKVSYDDVIELISECDKVISWNNVSKPTIH